MTLVWATYRAAARTRRHSPLRVTIALFTIARSLFQRIALASLYHAAYCRRTAQTDAWRYVACCACIFLSRRGAREAVALWALRHLPPLPASPISCQHRHCGRAPPPFKRHLLEGREHCCSGRRRGGGRGGRGPLLTPNLLSPLPPPPLLPSLFPGIAYHPTPPVFCVDTSGSG